MFTHIIDETFKLLIRAIILACIMYYRILLRVNIMLVFGAHYKLNCDENECL